MRCGMVGDGMMGNDRDDGMTGVGDEYDDDRARVSVG